MVDSCNWVENVPSRLLKRRKKCELGLQTKKEIKRGIRVRGAKRRTQEQPRESQPKSRVENGDVKWTMEEGTEKEEEGQKKITVENKSMKKKYIKKNINRGVSKFLEPHAIVRLND
jgi:hypothetical protein